MIEDVGRYGNVTARPFPDMLEKFDSRIKKNQIKSVRPPKDLLTSM